MSVLSAIQTFIKTYTDLDSDAPVWVNFLGEKPIGYSIVPLPGARIVEESITGQTSREFPFAFQSMEYTIEELGRIQSQEFYESFAEWLRTQSEVEAGLGSLLTMDSGQTPYKIEALGWGHLFTQGGAETGVYQIQCRLEYEQTT